MLVSLLMHANPSPILFARVVTPITDKTMINTFLDHGPYLWLNVLKLPGKPTFVQHANDVPQLASFCVRLIVYNFNDVNVVICLLMTEVHYVWAHAFRVDLPCTFEDYCE